MSNKKDSLVSARLIQHKSINQLNGKFEDSKLFLIVNDYEVDQIKDLPKNVFVVRQEIYQLIKKIIAIAPHDGLDSRNLLIDYLCCSQYTCYNEVDVALKALGV